MPTHTLYNLESLPVVINANEEATLPGESREFTDEEVAAGISGNWSRKDPRAGLAVEEEFKKRRKSEAKTAEVESTTTQETE